MKDLEDQLHELHAKHADAQAAWAQRLQQAEARSPAQAQQVRRSPHMRAATCQVQSCRHFQLSTAVSGLSMDVHCLQPAGLQRPCIIYIN